MSAAAAIALERPGSPWWVTGLFNFQGCDICTCGVTVDGARHCAHPDAVMPHRVVPVHLVRARGGACGPDGRLIVLPERRA